MKTTQLDGVNYTHIDTAQRLEHITKKHNAVKPSRRPARLRNTGLTNTRPGDEWIEEQAAYYAAQVRAHGFKKSYFLPKETRPQNLSTQHLSGLSGLPAHMAAASKYSLKQCAGLQFRPATLSTTSTRRNTNYEHTDNNQIQSNAGRLRDSGYLF